MTLTARTALSACSVPREMPKECGAGPGRGLREGSLKKSPDFAPIRALWRVGVTILFATCCERGELGRSCGDAGVNPSGFGCVSVLPLAGNLLSPVVLTQPGEAEAVKCILGFGGVFSAAPEARG